MCNIFFIKNAKGALLPIILAFGILVKNVGEPIFDQVRSVFTLNVNPLVAAQLCVCFSKSMSIFVCHTVNSLMHHLSVCEQLHFAGCLHEVRSQVSCLEDTGRRPRLIVQSVRAAPLHYVWMHMSCECSRCSAHSEPAKRHQLGGKSPFQVRSVVVLSSNNSHTPTI